MFIKIFLNTDTLFGVCIVYGCFCPTTGELNGCSRGQNDPQNLEYLLLTCYGKSSLTPEIHHCSFCTRTIEKLGKLSLHWTDEGRLASLGSHGLRILVVGNLFQLYWPQMQFLLITVNILLTILLLLVLLLLFEVLSCVCCCCFVCLFRLG